MKMLWNWLRAKTSGARASHSDEERQGPTTQLMEDSALMQQLLNAAAEEELTAREEAGGLDFAAAIRAHQSWKLKLLAAIEGRSSELVDPRQVARDDVCVLGQWLHGPGGRCFAHEPLFPVVRTAHARFHQLAGQVLRAAHSGDAVQARSLLATDYHRASVRVQGKLAELFMRLRPDEELSLNPLRRRPDIQPPRQP